MINCKYLFYIKAGPKIGLGHLRRSLAIATYLNKSEKSIFFLVEGDPVSINLIKDKGFKAARYSKASLNILNPRISIIDQKGDVSAQIKVLRSRGSKICLIDNASKARLKSDIVIYPVSHFKDDLSWKGFKGKKYIGGKYFPLNEEFLKLNPKNHKIFTVLVTMGGSDPNKLTEKVVKALQMSDEKFKMIIVLGAGSKKQRIPKDQRFIMVRNPKSIANLMAGSDMAITAFGTSLYELSYMKVPALILSNFIREKSEVDRFTAKGTSVKLGYYKDVSEERIRGTVERLMANQDTLLSMRKKCNFVDKFGAQRIVEALSRS